MDRPIARLDHEADLVALLRLGPCSLGLAGQFRRPYSSVSSKTPFFGILASSQARCAETKASPSMVKRLSSSPSSNRSSCQMMPNAARSSSPNLASLAKKRVLSSAWESRHQMTASPFFGLNCFQTAACSSRGAEAIVRSSYSFGMSPAPI